MALRRMDGFRRYALGVQYHGASFLGFSYQGKLHEDTILPDGTDLRGYRSVEGRLIQALEDLFPSQWENIQVSSRTDRGVHALKNTLHLDILHHEKQHNNNGHGCQEEARILEKLRRGLNHHLAQQHTSWHLERFRANSRKRKRSLPAYSMMGENWARNSVRDELRVLSVAVAPGMMDNPYALTDPTQPDQVDWNARFSATERTYIYRILHLPRDDDWGVPFEWDRSWRVRGDEPLDIMSMKAAAKYMEGTHDYSSFRGASCQRQSPVVTMKSIDLVSQFYGPHVFLGGGFGMGSDVLGFSTSSDSNKKNPILLTIQIVGNSFLYRQVRNMVGCLVAVGQGKLAPKDIPDLLQAKDRSAAPTMAPAHGLFLADVKHGNFLI